MEGARVLNGMWDGVSSSWLGRVRTRAALCAGNLVIALLFASLDAQSLLDAAPRQDSNIKSNSSIGPRLEHV